MTLFLPIQVCGMRVGVQTSRDGQSHPREQPISQGYRHHPCSMGFIQPSAMRASAHLHITALTLAPVSPLQSNWKLIKFWRYIQYQYVFFFFFFGASGKEPICKCRRHKKTGFSPWGGKIPWRRAWQPTPLFLPGESHGQRTSWATVHRITKSQTRLKGLSTAYTDMHSLWLESFPRKWRKEDYATNLRLGDCDCIKEGGKGERTWFSKKWDLRDSSSGWKWRSLLVSWVLRNKWDGIKNIRKPCGFIYQNFISFFLPVLPRFNYLNIIEH